MRCQEGKRPKCHVAVRDLPAPPLHRSMTPTMKRRKRASPFNHPQNKNNPKNAASRTCFLICSFSLLSVPLLNNLKIMSTEKDVEKDVDGVEVGGGGGVIIGFKDDMELGK
eukprot:10278667-Ditylum_brightwellii.AAC.1